MLAGLDVGGTHTDAVIADARSGRPAASVKTATRPDDPLPGIVEALERLFGEDGCEPARVRRLTVSTTLGLNALLTGTHEPVGMLALPGPGLDPALFWGDDPLLRVLPGAQDHRGRVIAEPDGASLASAFDACARHGARALGIVCKFSPKNPELEERLAEAAHKRFGPGMPVLTGARLSGSLDFPRRLHTVWCNAALSVPAQALLAALEAAARRLGLRCPLFLLKADAGSFSAAEAATDPAGTMGSGPAASLLGVWALMGHAAPGGEDALMIDMGGTSTDLALLADGQPLLDRRGLSIAGRPTLTRGLMTRSIALGGDSCLRAAGGALALGPDRLGPALALVPADLGRRPPTLTDAANTLGLARLGDCRVSVKALENLARDPACPAEAAGNARALAELAVASAAALIRREADALLAEVNSRPVYTIRELLVDKALAPARAHVIGGPAKALAPALEKALGMRADVPEESAVANALGAALALPTRAAELYADTQLGRMTIPAFGLKKTIGRGYDLTEAEEDMRAAFTDRAGADRAGAGETETAGTGLQANDTAFENRAPQMVFAESFAVLDENGGRGRIVRLRAQLAAGLAIEEAVGESVRSNA